MDRYWLITWTTYGTWLAGDERGFVSNVYADDDGPEVRLNVPGTDCDRAMPLLQRYVRDHMIGDPFYLNKEQADALISQYQDTCANSEVRTVCCQCYVQSHAPSCSVCRATPILITSGSYSRAGRHGAEKEMAAAGERRVLDRQGVGDEKKVGEAVVAAVIYVARRQPNPLAVFVGENCAA